MLPSITINQRACHIAASDPSLLATDLVDYLVRKGVPFRHAHHVTGRVVALAERLGKRLNELTLEELRSVEEKFGPDARHIFDLPQAMARRNLPGAPGAKEVRKQLQRWQRILR
jgi:argininosuccinate lyase